MKKLSLYAFLLLFATTTLFTSCGSDDDTPDPEPEPELNIIEWATDNGEYTLLLEAAEIAGLTPVLADPLNQYTIFGPKDGPFQAFLDFASGMPNTPVSAFDATTLGGILTNHALLGGRNAADLTQGYITNLGRVAFDTTGTITTSAYIDLSDGVAINGGTAATGGATVIEADLQASNGVIHSIDGVLAPPKLTTFVAVDPELTMTLAALSRQDLGVDFVATASGNDLLTVFAPTNAAWTDYLTANSYADVNAVPVPTMVGLITGHIISGNNRSGQIVDGSMATNLAGAMLTLNSAAGAVSITSANTTANVTFPDIQSQNGVIHKIDTVLY